MKKWIVCYEDKSGDTSKVWLYANSADEAAEEAKREYWDIEEILYVKEMK